MGGWIADNWSWRWIFYINLPIGFVGFVMVSVFLFDAPFVKKPRGIDAVRARAHGARASASCSSCLDLGEKDDWFDSGFIVALLMLAVLRDRRVRHPRAAWPREPILDLTVFNDRNFAVGTICIALVALGFNSSMLLVALYAQKILALGRLERRPRAGARRRSAP